MLATRASAPRVTAILVGGESGYDGEFNRVSNALVSIPGVTVSNHHLAGADRDVKTELLQRDVSIHP